MEPAVNGATYWTTAITASHYDGLSTAISSTPPITNPLAQDKHYFYGGANNPNIVPYEISYPTWIDGREYQSEEWTANGSGKLRSTSNLWVQRVCDPSEHCLGSNGLLLPAKAESSPNDPRLSSVQTTLSDTNQVTLKTYLYDRYNNTTDVTEQDYGSSAAGAVIRQSHTDYLTDTSYTSGGINLPALPRQERVFLGSTTYSQTTYEYDITAEPPGTCQIGARGQAPAGGCHAALVLRPGIVQMDGAYSARSINYRGNVSAVTRYLNTGPSDVHTYAQYDVAGNIVKTIDPLGNQSSIAYELNGNTSGNTYAFPLVLNKLGHYEIVAPAGAGGMGEVYKARDRRLHRTVALKVLTAHSDRFEREARTVASLNHPHICVLHDIGHENGAPYVVMEFLEGETLAARTARRPISLTEALRYAVQIGDALDRAHCAGVTHRDIKPGNVMLTRDGAKVLDFGLAKAASAKPAPSESTLTQALSTERTVLGTPQYMAPELFEGKAADARSDIWAFGAVLYEMVTGKRHSKDRAIRRSWARF